MSLLLAAEKHPGFTEEHPIGPESFQFKSLTDFTLFGLHVTVTRLVTMMFFAVILLCVLFLLALRKPKLVPGRGQFYAESIYGFVRDQICRDVIGPEGVRFATYLTSLLVFIFAMNLYEIVPLAQTPVTSRIAIPGMLAIISWALFIAVGVKQKGVRYFKEALFPPGVPKGLYILLTLFELLIISLQAYIFVTLSAVYVSESLAEEH